MLVLADDEDALAPGALRWGREARQMLKDLELALALTVRAGDVELRLTESERRVGEEDIAAAHLLVGVGERQTARMLHLRWEACVRRGKLVLRAAAYECLLHLAHEFGARSELDGVEGIVSLVRLRRRSGAGLRAQTNQAAEAALALLEDLAEGSWEASAAQQRG